MHPSSGATGVTFGPHEDSIEDEDDLRDGIDKLDACAGAIPVARGAGLEIRAAPPEVAAMLDPSPLKRLVLINTVWHKDEMGVRVEVFASEVDVPVIVGGIEL